MKKLYEWSKKLPLAVFHGLLLFLPLAVTFRTDELFEFPKMLLVYAAATLVGASILFSWVWHKRIVIPHTPFNIPLGLFVLSQILSTLFSLHTRTSLLGYYSRFNGGLFSTIAYAILFLSFVQFVSKADIPKLVRSLFIGGVLAALYAFPEHFGVSPSCVLLNGEWNASCWVQDVKTRAFGTFGQPNWLAAYMVLLLPLTVAQLLTSLHTLLASTQRKFSQVFPSILYTGMFVLFGSVLFFTQSRSGILGAFAALGLIFIGSSWVRASKRSVSNMASVVSVASIITLFGLMLTIGSPFNDRLLGFTRGLLPSATLTATSTPTSIAGPALEVGGSESGDIRKVVWQGAIDVWKRYPLFGSGVETFAYSYYKDRPLTHNALSEWDFLYNKAHNEFLNYLATTGIVGLVSFCVLYGIFIFLPFLWGVQRWKQDPSKPFSALFLIAIGAGLVGLAISNFFGFSTVMVSLLTFLLPAFAVKLHTESVTKKIEKPSPTKITTTKFSIFQTASFGLLGIGTLLLLHSVFKLYSADTNHALAKALTASDLQEAFYASQTAVDTLPNEPVFRDELAYIAARMAYALSVSNDSTSAATLTQYAISQSDQVMRQNPAHLNFYKTRARIFLLLSQLNPSFYTQAKETLNKARELAPTDSKLVYSLAVIALAEEKKEEQEILLLESLRLRPTDENARLALGQLYEEKKDFPKAKDQYQYVLEFINPTSAQAQARLASLSAQLK